jgi:hypothetical protein
VLILKNKNGANPFGIIEMLPDEERPMDNIIVTAKNIYELLINKPDIVRAWNGSVLFDFYFTRNDCVRVNQLIFSSDGISFECD